ncbi:AAA family ATPase [Acidithiobacillus thiooxidans]|uniref:AAA family ATPase n=1 Tax=Acidithiobacillus thiooxidans TaxID=930 RepID=UPI00285F271D|nr:AAA family ATPase [Acidithiobacillus thiooxidans]MDR7927241.1 AAA family ATPase [Acidithiobacillus thiooxidans]
MKITSFRVKKFRNIVDSGPINVDPFVTCLVGKNEAGKSGLLEALYLFNPAYDDKFDVNEQYPRWLAVKDRKTGALAEQTPISVTFDLDDSDKAAINEILGESVLADKSLTVERKYSNKITWSFKHNEKAAVDNLINNFPQNVASLLSDIDELDNLKRAIEGLTPVQVEDDSITPEDIILAKNAIKEAGLNENGVWDAIVNLLKPKLPKFFRFTGYSTLPGRIDFKAIIASDDDGPARSGLQTARALLKLAGTDLEQLGNDDYELRKGELEAVQIDLTNQVFEYWKQNPDLEVLIDVDKETVRQANDTSAVARYLDIRLRDKRTGYSNNFSQRSSGFRWFFSFLAAFGEFEGKHSPIILLDEPALTLHGKAQADFLRFINERLAPMSPVIYTTHSPFMVEADKLNRVRVVEDHGPPVGATSSDEVLASDPDSLFPLQAALGYDIAQNLFVGPHNLVVEGTSDYIYLKIMSDLCGASNRKSLDERWRVLPAGGATNIPTFVSLVGPHLDVTVLADSDTKGMQRVTNMIEQKLLADHRLIMANEATGADQADIEDLFSEGDYLKLYNMAFCSSLKLSDLPNGKRIVKRIEAHLGSTFIHGKVAEKFLRHHHEINLTDTSLDHFQEIIKLINNTIE